jgi:hypothetical protein
VLTPDHVGLTNRAQLTFAWFVGEAAEIPVDYIVIGETAVEPLVEVRLTGSFDAGIHRVRWADYDTHLEEGLSYQWSIALIVDTQRRDLDAVSPGAVRLEPAVDRDDPATGRPSYRALAERGIGYDAITDLSNAIAAAPNDTALRSRCASLLGQVGVGAAASFERRVALRPASD